MSKLLARHAECVYWMARYMERAENLARILEIQESYARDAQGGADWASVIRLNADDERFYKTHKVADGAAVLDFYILDGDNPTSILSAVRMARENARTIRALISTEVWAQINVFFNDLRALGPHDVRPSEINRLCDRIKSACQTHSGILDGTFYRDQSWMFYQLGKMLERADQTTRLLDIKYHLLLPVGADPGSAVDMSQWNALLRAAAGYHAFRRLHPRAMTPASVVRFLLVNDGFPRSTFACLRETDTVLHRMKSRFGIRGGNGALEQLDSLRASLLQAKIDDLAKTGLHEFLDAVQARIGDVGLALGQDFFGWEAEEDAA